MIWVTKLLQLDHFPMTRIQIFKIMNVRNGTTSSAIFGAETAGPANQARSLPIIS
jgi:hypothetical protein